MVWQPICAVIGGGKLDPDRMDITTSLAASRLMAQQRLMDLAANNMANANTPGFRASRLQFADWIDAQAGTTGTPGSRTITYTQDRATWREAQPGSLTHTGNPYDLAISDGQGYFTVSTANGPRLTRDGRFGPLPNGMLADDSGNPVLGTDGRPIQLSPNDTQVHIASDGSVSTENGQVGKIGVVTPADPMLLTAEGATLFRADTSTTPVTAPGIVQGAIEESNVQPVLEMTRMLDNERQFQMVTQMVQAESDRQQNAIDKLLPPSNS